MVFGERLVGPASPAAPSRPSPATSEGEGVWAWRGAGRKHPLIDPPYPAPVAPVPKKRLVQDEPTKSAIETLREKRMVLRDGLDIGRRRSTALKIHASTVSASITPGFHPRHLFVCLSRRCAARSDRLNRIFVCLVSCADSGKILLG